MVATEERKDLNTPYYPMKDEVRLLIGLYADTITFDSDNGLKNVVNLHFKNLEKYESYVSNPIIQAFTFEHSKYTLSVGSKLTVEIQTVND